MWLQPTMHKPRLLQMTGPCWCSRCEGATEEYLLPSLLPSKDTVFFLPPSSSSTSLTPVLPCTHHSHHSPSIISAPGLEGTHNAIPSSACDNWDGKGHGIPTYFRGSDGSLADPLVDRVPGPGSQHAGKQGVEVPGAQALAVRLHLLHVCPDQRLPEAAVVQAELVREHLQHGQQGQGLSLSPKEAQRDSLARLALQGPASLTKCKAIIS